MVAEPTAVLGAGSWGTALAIHLVRAGGEVRLWGRDPVAMAAMAGQRCNARYLPDAPFPDGLTSTADLAAAVGGCRRLLIAVPSEAFRPLLRRLVPLLHADTGLVWATKGLEPDSGRFLHEVAREELDARCPMALVSGPSFAGEVARGLPTALVAASADERFAGEVAGWLHGGTLRVYSSTDMIGVALGGAFKNVLAIAAGISDGLGFGANARAALITRGLAELMRLGVRAGARGETLVGLSGMGDLVLTCTDDQSRNRRLGLALGRGEPADSAIQRIGQAVEGARTAAVAVRKAAELGVEMPICEQVQRVLYEGLAPADAVAELLARDLKPEF